MYKYAHLPGFGLIYLGDFPFRHHGFWSECCTMQNCRSNMVKWRSQIPWVFVLGCCCHGDAVAREVELLYDLVNQYGESHKAS